MPNKPGRLIIDKIGRAPIDFLQFETGSGSLGSDSAFLKNRLLRYQVPESGVIEG